ncbi:MAG TPA: PLDc N-terminal domain-containing protein [Verrucomicrobiae bacterium]|nr:PLDc N-terminal domain-containing protein [Verrucomicrobiae bacterium]
MHAIAPLFSLVINFPVGILGILAFALWIWALVNALTNPRLSGGEKIAWVLVIIFLNVLGALIYLLVARRK